MLWTLKHAVRTNAAWVAGSHLLSVSGRPAASQASMVWVYQNRIGVAPRMAFGGSIVPSGFRNLLCVDPGGKTAVRQAESLAELAGGDLGVVHSRASHAAAACNLGVGQQVAAEHIANRKQVRRVKVAAVQTRVQSHVRKPSGNLVIAAK